MILSCPAAGFKRGRSTRVASVALTLGLALACAAWAGESTDRSTVSIPLDKWPQGKVDLEVDHLLGTVTYSAGPDDRIEIVTVRTGTGGSPEESLRHRETIRLVTTEDERTIRAATLAWGFPDFQRALGYVVRGDRPAQAHLFIKAPGRVRAWLRSEFGSITLSDAVGQVSATTRKEPIHVKGAKGSLILTTDGGTVWLEGDLDAKVRLQTSSGHVHASGMKGDLDARTDSGNISVDFRELGTGDQHLTSESGDVTVSVPADSRVRFEVHAVLEQITTSLRLDNVQKAVRRLIGTLNEPRCQLEVRTHGGKVRLSGR